MGSSSPEAAQGPDGKRHDSFLPDKLNLKAGVPTTIRLENTDDVMHGFVILDLGITQMVPAGKAGAPAILTFTVTPSKPGTYRFFCPVPCDTDNNGWAMTADRNAHGPDQDGFMAGYLTVS